jgi:hypothetical protein
MDTYTLFKRVVRRFFSDKGQQARIWSDHVMISGHDMKKIFMLGFNQLVRSLTSINGRLLSPGDDDNQEFFNHARGR